MRRLRTNSNTASADSLVGPALRRDDERVGYVVMKEIK